MQISELAVTTGDKIDVRLGMPSQNTFLEHVKKRPIIEFRDIHRDVPIAELARLTHRHMENKHI